jgi:RNA polymerase sigma-70 factor (ECF subfamily)
MGTVSIMASTTSLAEQELVEAACGGDEEAFRSLVEPYRLPLLAHCYRMLRSSHDADDALQDALLRAWRGLCGFAGRSAVRNWLYRIATNVCLDVIARRPRRVVPIDYASAVASDSNDPEAGRIDSEALRVTVGAAPPEARYEQRESAELAFAALLEHLPPRQRAALILRDVLGLSAKEVSGLLGMTVPSVNSALQRAHKAVDERLGVRTRQSIRPRRDRHVRETVRRFVDAVDRGDVDAIVRLVAEDPTFATPARAG